MQRSYYVCPNCDLNVSNQIVLLSFIAFHLNLIYWIKKHIVLNAYDLMIPRYRNIIWDNKNFRFMNFSKILQVVYIKTVYKGKPPLYNIILRSDTAVLKMVLIGIWTRGVWWCLGLPYYIYQDYYIINICYFSHILYLLTITPLWSI